MHSKIKINKQQPTGLEHESEEMMTELPLDKSTVVLNWSAHHLFKWTWVDCGLALDAESPNYILPSAAEQRNVS